MFSHMYCRKWEKVPLHLRWSYHQSKRGPICPNHSIHGDGRRGSVIGGSTVPPSTLRRAAVRTAVRLRSLSMTSRNRIRRPSGTSDLGVVVLYGNNRVIFSNDVQPRHRRRGSNHRKASELTDTITGSRRRFPSASAIESVWGWMSARPSASSRFRRIYPRLHCQRLPRWRSTWVSHRHRSRF